MHNSRFTNSAVSEKHKIKRNFKLVYDDEGKVLCGVNSKSICDLNGNKIAKFSAFERNNNDVKQTKYTSNFGTFRFVGKALYLENNRIGQVKSGPSKSSVLLLLITCLLLTLVFGIVAIIDTPNDDRPVIALEDKDGVITASKKIAVFDDIIAPGNEGVYYFDINNVNGRDLTYSFSIKEYYNGKVINEFPIRYRIKMNNMFMLNEDNWVTSDKLTFNELIIADRSTQQFALQWSWPYESGNDSLDTYFGKDHGEYSLVISITAQFTEGEI